MTRQVPWLEWSTDSTLTSSTSTSPIDIPFGPSPTTIEASLENLLSGTDYYYRVVATNTAGTSSGRILSFRTFSLPDPMALPAIQIFPREATVSGSVNPNGLDADAWFQTGFDPEFGSVLYRTSPTISVGDGQAFVPVDHLIDQLAPASRYYYRVTAVNTWGISHSETLSFNTPLAGDTCWAKEYLAISDSRDKKLDRLLSVDETSDGGFILLGTRLTTPTQSDSIIKVNSKGGVEWSFDYINGASSVATPRTGVVKKISAGRYIEAGAIQGGHSWIAERNVDGDIVWRKIYEAVAGSPTPWDGIIKDIEILPDGYIVLGLLAVFKIDTTGNIEWQYQYEGIGNGEVNDITVVSDGYVLAGDTDAFGAGASDVLAFKLDQNGNVIWNYAYGSSDSEAGRAITKTTIGFLLPQRPPIKACGCWI